MWKSGNKTMIFHKRKAAIHAYTMNTIFYKIYQSFILTSVFIYCKDVPIVKHAQAVTVTIHHIVELCTKLTIQAKLLHRHISGLWFLSELLCCTSKRLDNVWICLHFPLKKKNNSTTTNAQNHFSKHLFFSLLHQNLHLCAERTSALLLRNWQTWYCFDDFDEFI